MGEEKFSPTVDHQLLSKFLKESTQMLGNFPFAAQLLNALSHSDTRIVRNLIEICSCECHGCGDDIALLSHRIDNVLLVNLLGDTLV